MAFIGHEGFDAISSSGDATPFDYAAVNAVGTTSPRYSGGQHATDLTDGANGVGWNVPNQSKIIQGGAFESDGTNTFTVFRTYDGTTVHTALRLNCGAAKNITVYRGDGSTLLGTSAALTAELGNGVWIYVEWEVVISDTVGTIKVWINGATTPVLDLSGLDTQNTANAFATRARFNRASKLDDIYLLDGSGSAPFNARLGDYRVYTLYPTSDDSIQFTPLSGSNFSNVDDQGTGGIDEDTTYVESSTVGHIDRYGITDLPTGAVPIAVEVRYVAKKTDAGAREMRGKLDSGGTNSNDLTKTLTTSYVHYRRLLELDPTDSAAWTKAKVDALKVGFEVIT